MKIRYAVSLAAALFATPVAAENEKPAEVAAQTIEKACLHALDQTFDAATKSDFTKAQFFVTMWDKTGCGALSTHSFENAAWMRKYVDAFTLEK